MKIRSILSILVICAAANVFAQSHPKTIRNHFAGIQTNRAAGKTTTFNAYRCVAIALSSYNGASYDALDSQAYAYTGARGGSPMGLMKYDNGHEYYSMGGIPVPAGLTTQTFDSHNNLLVHTGQQYDFSSSTFVNTYRYTYTYDAMNNLITEIDQMWNASTASWINNNKYIKTYTTASRVATDTEMIWNGSSWDNYTFVVYTYNSLHDPLVSITKQWNSSTSTFDLYQKDTMVYDLSNNLSYDLMYNYDMMGNTWTPGDKTSYSSYLAPGLFRIVTNQYWDGSTSTFTNTYKDSISYNSNNLPLYIFEKNAGPGNTWVTDTGSMRGHYYYESYASGITAINAPATLDIYPNPCSSQLNIAAPYLISSITISNLIGQTVYNNEFGSEKVQVNVNDLPRGAYIIRINGTEVRKFVKE